MLVGYLRRNSLAAFPKTICRLLQLRTHAAGKVARPCAPSSDAGRPAMPVQLARQSPTSQSQPRSIPYPRPRRGSSGDRREQLERGVRAVPGADLQRHPMRRPGRDIRNPDRDAFKTNRRPDDDRATDCHGREFIGACAGQDERRMSAACRCAQSTCGRVPTIGLQRGSTCRITTALVCL